MTCAKLVAQNHACFDWRGCWEAAHSPVQRSLSAIPCARSWQAEPTQQVAAVVDLIAVHCEYFEGLRFRRARSSAETRLLSTTPPPAATTTRSSDVNVHSLYISDALRDHLREEKTRTP